MPYRSRSRNNSGPAQHSGQFALTADEVGRLLGAIDDGRDLALLSLAIATGTRREDLVAIPVSGYDRPHGTVQFYEAKKRRTRTVPLDPGAARRLDIYLGSRPRSSRWLFPSDRTRSRGHLSGRKAYSVLQHWLEAAGLPRRPFHSLRATCYKLCKARGWSVEQSAALIGDTIRVAMEFYGVATPGELQETMRQRPLL